MKNAIRMVGAICAAGTVTGCAFDQKIAQPTVVPVMAVRHSVESADGYYALGRYHHGGDRFADARRAYESALRLDPRHESAFNALAVLHAQSGNLDQARAMLATLIERRPKAAHFHGNIGYVHMLSGEYDAARRALETALALDPGERRARANLAIVMERIGARQAAGTTAREAPRPATVLGRPEAGGSEPGSAHAQAITQVAPHIYTLGTASGAAARVQAEPRASIRPAPAPAAVRPARPNIEISNGNGVRGMAKAVAGVIGNANVVVARLTNQKPFNVPTTHVRFSKGFEPEARRLAHQIGSGVPVEYETGPIAADIRVVLGRDMTDVSAMRAHYRENSQMAGLADGNGS